MKIFYKAALILVLFPSLVVAICLTPVAYVQCSDLEPDEWEDIVGDIDAPDVDFFYFTAYPVDLLHTDSPVFSEISASHFNSLDWFFTQTFLRELNLSPVLLL